ncbi:helix-turn-helix transcriptional regulator [Halorubrum aethiopicum]|uniref:helix-turn-helix transcriptional regulator n=1 Tax=Halorubrum aethiopicum TaxID=1758255 RepID=UPI00082EC144|nr:helix-turn-helix domain-containing protein [Halorubrum aethiopicum]
MRNPAIRVLLVAFLAVALVAGAGVAVGEVAPSTHPSPPESTPTSSIGTAASPQVDGTAVPTGETRIRIDLRSNRDARWEVVVRYEFADPNRTAAFETVGERFVEGEVGPTPALFERFAEEASRNTDREMSVVNVEREYVVIEDPETAGNGTDGGDSSGAGAAETGESGEIAAAGELRLTFVWTEFLAEDGEDLVLGDALTTANNGTWLRSLESGQTIEVTTPDGYSISGTPGANVRLEDNAVVIQGPRVFADGDRVAVVYAPTPTTPAGETPPWTLLAGAIVLAAVVIAGGLVGYRRYGSGDGTTATEPDRPGPGTGSETRTVDEDETVGEGADDDLAGGAGDEPEEDLSLLSDEERVERLLGRNGGRMRQADIVAETGWSDAKVSQLLSAMADEGRVEKLRLGRENLISLPDDASDASGPDGPNGSEDSADGDGT